MHDAALEGMKTLASLSLLALAACAHSSDTGAPPPRGPDFVAATAPRPAAPTLAASAGTKPIDPVDVVDFDYASADLSSTAQAQIQRSIEFLAKHPADRIVLEGHTDRSGTLAFNEDLATLRAVRVRDALIDAGIAPDRVVVAVFADQQADPGVNFYDRRVVMTATHRPTMTAVTDELAKLHALSVTYDDARGRHVVMPNAQDIGSR